MNVVDIKKIFAVFGLFLLLVGCNKQDDSPLEHRLVSKIEYYWSSGEVSGLDYTDEFRYDRLNRITEIISTIGNNTNRTLIRYPSKDGMVVTVSGVTYNNPVYSPFGNSGYNLNNSGYVTSQTNGYNVEGTWRYVNGYLQRREIFRTFVFEEETTVHTGMFYLIYVWENGNIVTLMEEISAQSLEQNSFLTVNFEYSTLENKPSSIDFGNLYDPGGLLPRGLFGKSTLNLPSKVTITRDEGSKNIINFRFELDAEGYPVKIFMQENDESEALNAVITYEDAP